MTNNANQTSNSASIDNEEVGVPEEAIPLPSTGSKNKVVTLQTDRGDTVKIAAETCLPSQQQRKSFLLVGRQAASADLRIQHKSISRKHAAFYYGENYQTIYLKDLGGKHGTTVNGQRLQQDTPIELQSGDTIVFGNVRGSPFKVNIPTSSMDHGNNTSDQKQKQGLSLEENVGAVETTALKTKNQQVLEKAGEGLSGRARRKAEIDAMMASLEDRPTYQKAHAAIASSSETTATATTTEPQNEQKATATTEDQALQATAKKFKLPVTKIFTLPPESDRRHASTCLAVDTKGARFVVGSSDTHLRLYDFGGMDQNRRCESFKTVVPDDGYPLQDCVYSNTGDRVLVSTGSPQPVVLTREGEEVIKFVRGDMCVMDQTKTIGHTATVTAVSWHPFERNVVLTGSNDGSARLWNLTGRTQFQMLCCGKVFLAKTKRGQRTAVTAICFHPGGREFAVGTACGSIQIWSGARVSGRPERAVYDAHGGEQRPIHSLTYNVDGSILASRSAEDDTVKVWNARKLSRSAKPMIICRQLPTLHERANAAFSPDGKLLCAGSSMFQQNDNNTPQQQQRQQKSEQDRQEIGSLKFYSLQQSTMHSGGGDAFIDPILSIDTENNASPVLVKWHSKINQVITACSNGGVVIFYDPQRSFKGALLPAAKVSRGEDDLTALLRTRVPQGSAAFVGTSEILTPNALPMYRKEEISDRKRKRLERKDPVKSREPERPTSGKHKKGGQVGGSLTLQQFVSDQSTAQTKAIAKTNPREALMKYSEGRSFISQAYKGNKERILAEKTMEEEEEEMKNPEK